MSHIHTHIHTHIHKLHTLLIYTHTHIYIYVLTHRFFVKCCRPCFFYSNCLEMFWAACSSVAMQLEGERGENCCRALQLCDQQRRTTRSNLIRQSPHCYSNCYMQNHDASINIVNVCMYSCMFVRMLCLCYVYKVCNVIMNSCSFTLCFAMYCVAFYFVLYCNALH